MQIGRTIVIVFLLLRTSLGVLSQDAPLNDDAANPTELGVGGLPVIEGTTLGATAAVGEPYGSVLPPGSFSIRLVQVDCIDG